MPKKKSPPIPKRSLAEKMTRRAAQETAEVAAELTGKAEKLRTLQSMAPTDLEATKLARGLFVKTGFSPVAAMIEMAMDPASGLKPADRATLLCRLAEYEAPKAKSVDMDKAGERGAGITIQLTAFASSDRSALSAGPKRPLKDYDEFGAAEPNAPSTAAAGKEGVGGA